MTNDSARFHAWSGVSEHPRRHKHTQRWRQMFVVGDSWTCMSVMEVIGRGSALKPSWWARARGAQAHWHTFLWNYLGIINIIFNISLILTWQTASKVSDLLFRTLREHKTESMVCQVMAWCFLIFPVVTCLTCSETSTSLTLWGLTRWSGEVRVLFVMRPHAGARHWTNLWNHVGKSDIATGVNDKDNFA